MNENLFSILIVTQLFDKKINNRKEMTIIKKGYKCFLISYDLYKNMNYYNL